MLTKRIIDSPLEKALSTEVLRLSFDSIVAETDVADVAVSQHRVGDDERKAGGVVVTSHASQFSPADWIGGMPKPAFVACCQFDLWRILEEELDHVTKVLGHVPNVILEGS
ncbi:MAG: hypothetical protein JWP89_563 [Schlesneria sp.]|nr:hypothetical protein [Schlesneria sp.]